jgi:hypothetical protein
MIPETEKHDRLKQQATKPVAKVPQAQRDCFALGRSTNIDLTATGIG